MIPFSILNLILILAIISIVVLIFVFRKALKKWYHKIDLFLIEFSNKLKPEFSLIKTVDRMRFIFSLMFVEWIVVTTLLVIVLTIKNQFGVFLNSMKISNITDYLQHSNSNNLTCGINHCTLNTGPSFSFENLSIVIVLITGLVIYAHFFRMISEDPFNTVKSETRKKYFSFFENLFWIAFVFSFILIIGLLQGFVSDPEFQLVLLAYAWIHIIILGPIAHNFKTIFESYENIERFNKITLGDSPETPWYKRYNDLNQGDVFSTYIFLTTLEVALIGFLLNFNIFTLILIESTFILIHIWISRISQIPKNKHTLILLADPPIENVFILDDSSDEYYRILSKEYGIRKIMKSAVKQTWISEKCEKPELKRGEK